MPSECHVGAVGICYVGHVFLDHSVAAVASEGAWDIQRTPKPYKMTRIGFQSSKVLLFRHVYPFLHALV